jgi:hypothetical protein
MFKRSISPPECGKKEEEEEEGKTMVESVSAQ